MVDWSAIKTEYVTGESSYRELAKKNDVALRTLAERAKNEKWVEARNEHRNTVATKVVQNIEAGILILSSLFKQYDETTALMAYNCGRAKANRMIESGITSTSYTRKVKAFTETLQVKERIYIFE